MIKRLLNQLPYAILAGILAVTGVGIVSQVARELRQAESPTGGLGQGTQRPHYTGAAECLTQGSGHPESCRGELPECEQEDGSGPGVMCWFTSDGLLWLQTGDDH